MVNNPGNKPAGLPENWSQLTPEQKRQYRLNRFLDPDDVKFVGPEAKKAYRVRAQRLVDVYNVQEPDKVPVSLPIGNLPYIMAGINMHTAMYDYEKAVQACKEFNARYSEELEYFASPMNTPGKALEILDYKLYAWPGHGLSVDAPGYQFVEGEYMRPEEYDDLIRDPSDFWLRTYLPRVFGSYESFKKWLPLTDIVEMPTQEIMPLALPEVQDTLRKMLKAGKELQKRARATAEFRGLGPSLGFPNRMGALNVVPFDALGDTLRGTQAIMKDMYRRPDKLLKALDVIADLTIHSILTAPNISRIFMAMFPLHKGADGWMSQKQFETFYLPSMKKVMDGLIREGLIILLFAEGSYNTRIDSMTDFPKGTVTWLFDQTDMARAKRVLGAKYCIQGNIPSSMVVTAAPSEVKEYCRNLIKTCGNGGGYMLAAGCVPDNPKLENLRAMLAAVDEYGVYRR
jgi:hypothetical protein